MAERRLQRVDAVEQVEDAPQCRVVPRQPRPEAWDAVG
ncbi:MAG: hypothetical protein QOK11_2343, partial [Pseudonocardiales bacterium]|nr:hypothetical protein [Pseudonocardiales bacterium]